MDPKYFQNKKNALTDKGTNFLSTTRTLLIICLIVYQLSASAIVGQIQRFPDVQLQTIRLTGTVKDGVTGAALKGVKVLVEGGITGVVSDMEGHFTAEVPGPESILIFSLEGYATEKVALDGQSQIDITLSPVTANLVNIGYGTQPKNDVTLATNTLRMEGFATQATTRVEQTLQGTVSGVQVISPNGQPGVPLYVRIRGANSIMGSNEPLYVIDGYIGGNIESLFPDDIESVEVLKDGAATAIYGSRGSNGVVLITTSTSSEGKMKVDFSSWMSKASMPKYLPLMNAYEFATIVNQTAQYYSYPAFSNDQLAAFINNNGTNWQKEITRSSFVKNYHLKMSGGISNVHYLFSISHLDQPGLLINQWYKKTTARANFDVKANEKLSFKFNLIGLFAQSRNNDYQGDVSDPLAQALRWDPTIPVKDAKGNYNLYPTFGWVYINPVAEANNRISDDNTSSFTGTGSLTYLIFKGFTFNSSVTYEVRDQYAPQLFGKQTDEGLASNDRAVVNNTRYWCFQNSNYFIYQAGFGEHAIMLTALYEQQHRENINVLAQSKNLSTYSTGYYNLSLGAKQTVSSGYWSDAFQSFMVRANYSYKGKYLLTASLRDDGYSHLIKKYTMYPSLAVGWNLGKESFLQNVKIISALKLRASYGVAGNQAVSPYATIPQINQGGTYYYDTTPTTVFSPGAPVSGSLKWEDTEQFDMGIDASFFKGRMTFSADAYHKKSKNLLYNMQAPYYYGTQYTGHTTYSTNISYLTNIGSIENKGVEFSIGGTPVSVGKLKWDTYFTISFNRNKLVGLGGLDNILISGVSSRSIQSVLSVLKVGMPLGEFYGFQFLGTWNEVSPDQRYQPGDAKYVIVDPETFTFDHNNPNRMPIGNSQPKYTFGFTNEVTYGNFALNLMVQGTHGNQAYSQTIALTNIAGSPTSKDALNMWTPTHQTDFPKYGDLINSSRYVYDASYIKLKNISLSYRVPGKILNRLKIRQLEVYVSGQNIFTVTKFPGYDPEVTNGINAATQGLELGEVPNPKTFTLGLRAGL